MRGLALAAAFLTSISAISSVSADETADVAAVKRGRFVAEVICSTCHVIPDQRFPRALLRPTPSFEEIANRPDLTPGALHEFLGTTHWDMKTLPMTMPDFMLSEKEKGDVIAYIHSLRRKP